MTQLEAAKKNKPTELIRKISGIEKVPVSKIIKEIARGRLVVPLNNKHSISKPCGVGHGLSTKINANIGTSTDSCSIPAELEKLDAAVKYGADTVMDLSVGPDIRGMRKAIMQKSPIPVGTVPVYEVAVNAQSKNSDPFAFGGKEVLDVLRAQAEEGVDFFTIHSGITQKTLKRLSSQKRILDIVSRGGSIIAAWMRIHKKENPFYEYFDQILDLAYGYDITLSLGDGLRPGSVMDATDRGQIAELNVLGELCRRAYKKNVQVMVEGPGHVPLNEIKKNILMQKKVCRGAPFYVLGPLVTDVAPGYDHITGAIGGALAAGYGADFLCFVTASEHLRHPSTDDVRDAVIASRIAAHAGDIVKYGKRALSWDTEISKARKARDWQKQIELAIDPEKARQYRESSKPADAKVCTMCGSYCSILLGEESKLRV